MRILIDTCVMMDVLRDREPFAEAAQTILLGVERGYLDGFLTANQITDLHYLLRQEIHSEAEVREILRGLFELVGILDTTSEDCRRALVSERKDFEDAVEIEAAVRERVDGIVTRNVRDFEDSPIPVYTPQGFVEKFLRGGEMAEALR